MRERVRAEIQVDPPSAPTWALHYRAPVLSAAIDYVELRAEVLGNVIH
jgi:hypothetical protein